jgi:hypothetical protein
MFKRALVAVMAAAALSGAAALPALAAAPSSGGGVSINATVAYSETIELTGLTPTIDFPGPTPAGEATVRGDAESYTVTEDGGSGYTLTITPSATGLSDGSGDTIPNTNDLSVTENDFTPAHTFDFSGDTAVTIDHELTDPESGDVTTNYSESWTLVVPLDTPGGSYNETVTYLALADS